MTGLRGKSRRWVRRRQALGALGLLVSPWVGLPLLVAFSIKWPLENRPPYWFLVWGPTIAALTLGALVSGNLTHHVYIPILIGAVVLVIGPDRTAVVTGLTVGLAILLLVGVVAHQVKRNEWSTHPWTANTGTAWKRAGFIQGIDARDTDTWVVQSWQADTHVAEAKFTTQVRLSSGTVGTRWTRVADVTVTYSQDPQEEVDVATFGNIQHDGLAAYRTLISTSPLANRTFRATAHVRGSASPSSANCRGFIFQGGTAPYDSTCIPFQLEDEWTRVSATFSAPESLDSEALRIGFGGLKDAEFSVARFKLEELTHSGWEAHDRLVPNGVQGRLEWTGPAGEVVRTFGRPMLPSPGEWQELDASASDMGVPPGTTIKLILTFEPGAIYELGRLKTSFANAQGDQTQGRRSDQVGRIGLWFGHPNLAGHTLATAGLVVALLGPAPLLPISAVLTAASIGMTGSRIAFWVFIAGFVVILLQRRFSGTWRIVVAMSLATLLLIGVIPSLPNRLFSIEDSSPVTRTEILSTAWESIKESPWDRRGVDSIDSLLREREPIATGERIAHAHNLWVDAGFELGVLGLIAYVWFFLALGYTSWKTGGLPSLFLVIAIFSLNLLDSTLLTGSILLLLMLAVYGRAPSTQRWESAS